MTKPSKLVEEWLVSAENDLAYAKVGFAETSLWANVCFSCQQAFEKYLKAYLISKKVDFPMTHDLTRLLNLCLKNDPAFSEFEELASMITPYGSAARYPDIGALEFSREQAEQALESAEKLGRFVKNKLSNHVARRP